jgi:hypothetical protein
MVNHLILLYSLLIFQGTEQPKYFVEVDRESCLTCVGPVDEVRARIIKQFKIPSSAFVGKRDKANYILRIATVYASCRWTVLYNDPEKQDEIFIASKSVYYCKNAIKDVVVAAMDDWQKRKKSGTWNISMTMPQHLLH